MNKVISSVNTFRNAGSEVYLVGSQKHRHSREFIAEQPGLDKVENKDKRDHTCKDVDFWYGFSSSDCPTTTRIELTLENRAGSSLCFYIATSIYRSKFSSRKWIYFRDDSFCKYQWKIPSRRRGVPWRVDGKLLHPVWPPTCLVSTHVVYHSDKERRVQIEVG